MQSDFDVTRISRGERPAVHRYYDVPVEEPGGTRVMYFEFDEDRIPGPGSLIVARGDGSSARAVARCEEAIGHVGGNGTWVGPGRIAFSPRQQSEAGAIIRDLDGGREQVLDADVRSFHPPTGRGVLLGDSGYAQADRYAGRQRLSRWDAGTGEATPLLTAAQAHALHPERDRFDAAKTNFQNPKFSPDGARLFTVFGTEVYRKSARDPDYPRIKSLIVFDADGGNARYLGEFGHHPMWTPDGSAILAYVRREGGQDLMLYPADGGEPEMLLADAPGVHGTLDRAGERLITDEMDAAAGQAKITLLDVASGERTTLAAGRHGKTDHVTGTHPHPQWSRDETRVFFNMADEGVPQFYAARL